MSVRKSKLLQKQLSAGEFEQAEKTAQLFAGDSSMGPDEFFSDLRHAVNLRQARLVEILTEGNLRFFAPVDSALSLQQRLDEVTLLLASCRREKMDESAKRLVGLILSLLEKQPLTGEFAAQDALAGVAKFAEIAGRYALRRKDVEWFGEIATQTFGWASRLQQVGLAEFFLPTLDAWMHRITRNDLVEALPAFFDAVYFLYLAEADQEAFMTDFLLEWRATATIACLNPVSPMASEWVAQLLLLTIRTENPICFRPVVQRIGEVAGLAVIKHSLQDSFPVFRPLLDVGRVNLTDELKFGSGPDPASLRQRIIRLICDEMLKISDMASRAEVMAVAGDKIEQAYQCWIKDPAYESQLTSIERFCQLLLIYWSMNRKRAARKWTPRDTRLSDPILTDEDRAKLTFLL